LKLSRVERTRDHNLPTHPGNWYSISIQDLPIPFLQKNLSDIRILHS
jgi:hypothetical protein